MGCHRSDLPLRNCHMGDSPLRVGLAMCPTIRRLRVWSPDDAGHRQPIRGPSSVLHRLSHQPAQWVGEAVLVNREDKQVSPMTYRIIITGSRKYEWKHRVWAYLDSMLAYHPDLLVATGGCISGADWMAFQWARAKGLDVEVNEADWEDEGPSAGPIRNSAMVNAGAEQCVGFWLPTGDRRENRGTRDCMVKADKAGILCLAAWGDQAPEPWHAKKYQSEVKKILTPYKR